MANIEVRILLPIDNRIITVELDGTMTADEVINELIREKAIAATEVWCQLFIKGGKEIKHNQRLVDADLDDDTIIRVLPMTDAGGKKESGNRLSNMPALDANSLRKFSIEDIRQSAAAVAMIIDMHDSISDKYEEKSNLL